MCKLTKLLSVMRWWADVQIIGNVITVSCSLGCSHATLSRALLTGCCSLHYGMVEMVTEVLIGPNSPYGCFSSLELSKDAGSLCLHTCMHTEAYAHTHKHTHMQIQQTQAAVQLCICWHARSHHCPTIISVSRHYQHYVDILAGCIPS